MTPPRVNKRRAGMVLALGTALLGSCNSNSGSSGEVAETTTSGSVRVAVDATFEPILKSHVDTFQKLYQYAKVEASYKPETEVMRALLDDKVRAVVVTRKLNAEETKYFEQLKIVPRTTHVATDGVAIIVHPSNPDSLFTMAQLRDIFTGTASKWSQVTGKTGKLGAINVVFDQNHSSTARYAQDSITRGAPLTKQATASESNPKLIEYVAAHPNAIGVIGVNWISDLDDKQVQRFLRQVRVAGISRKSAPSPKDYFQPYQAYLAQKEYPLRRDIYIVSREARTGLGTGFASFVAGNKGQLIFLKSGLMPATGQVRLVQINPE